MPLNRYLVRIDVPEGVWEAREELDRSKLPATWSAIPAGWGSVEIGSRWLSSMRSSILLVPSVIMTEEWVALVNPLHSSVKRIRASGRAHVRVQPAIPAESGVENIALDLSAASAFAFPCKSCNVLDPTGVDVA